MLNINATLIAIVINFIILVYVLNYFLYKPVMKMLEDRKSHVDEALAQAEAKLDSAKAFMEEGRDSVNKANLTAREIISQATSAAGKIRKESLAKTKKEIDEQRERVKEEIRQYKIGSKKMVISEAAKLSVMIAEKIIMKKIDMRSQKHLIKDFIEGMKN